MRLRYILTDLAADVEAGAAVEMAPHEWRADTWHFDESKYDFRASAAVSASFTIAGFSLLFLIVARLFRWLCDHIEGVIKRLRDEVAGLHLTEAEVSRVTSSREMMDDIRRKRKFRNCGESFLFMLIDLSLMADNICQILAIVLLSANPTYLVYQSMYLAGLAIPLFLDGRNVYRDRWCVAVLCMTAGADSVCRVFSVPFSRRRRPPGQFGWSMFGQLRKMSNKAATAPPHELLEMVEVKTSKVDWEALTPVYSATAAPRSATTSHETDMVHPERHDLDWVLKFPVVQLWLMIRGWQQVRYQ